MPATVFVLNDICDVMSYPHKCSKINWYYDCDNNLQHNQTRMPNAKIEYAARARHVAS